MENAIVSGYTPDDLRQLALIGLWEANKHYKPEKGSFKSILWLKVRDTVSQALFKQVIIDGEQVRVLRGMVEDVKYFGDWDYTNYLKSADSPESGAYAMEILEKAPINDKDRELLETILEKGQRPAIEQKMKEWGIGERGVQQRIKRYKPKIKTILC